MREITILNTSSATHLLIVSTKVSYHTLSVWPYSYKENIISSAIYRTDNFYEEFFLSFGNIVIGVWILTMKYDDMSTLKNGFSCKVYLSNLYNYSNYIFINNLASECIIQNLFGKDFLKSMVSLPGSKGGDNGSNI